MSRGVEGVKLESPAGSPLEVSSSESSAVFGAETSCFQSDKGGPSVLKYMLGCTELNFN